MKHAGAGIVLALAMGCQGQIDGVNQNGGKGSGGAASATGGGTGTGGSGQGSGGSGKGSGGASTGSGGSGGTTPAGSGGTGTSGSGGATMTVDCSKPRAAAARAQLLSASQYTHTVQDLFQATGNPGEPLGNQVFAQLDQAGVEQRATVAASVAQEAAANLAKWAPCTPPATGDATTCEQQIIDKIGTRAFRRSLTSGEKADMKTLFDAGIKEKDFATGVEWYLTGLLQSPDFMYQIVRPETGEVVGDVRPLAPYDYATRLAYFVWDTAPDDKLLTAAGANELADSAKRQTHIDRMIQDAKFMRGVESFYNQWLHTDAFRTLARDADGFDASVVQDAIAIERGPQEMQRSTQYFPFTQQICRHASADMRVQIIEMLWTVAYADGALDPDEDALIRQVAGLIQVSDWERGAARKRALEKLASSEPVAD